MNWTPLHCHSTFSLLDGLSKTEAIAKRCKSLGYKSCAITDHGTIGGTISFAKACKKYDISPILGCEFYVSQKDSEEKNKENGKHSHLCVLAKGMDGWRSLIKASSASNSQENFYRKPRLDLKKIASYSNGNLIAFSGHPGSDLCNVLFDDVKSAYSASEYEVARTFVHPDWEKRAVSLIHLYYDLFGKDNFFVEIQMIDKINMPAAEVAGKILRYICKKNKFKSVGTPDAHYPAEEDAVDQRVLLCTALKTNMKNIAKSIDNDEEFGLSSFFKSNKFYIPDIEEVKELYLPEEIENSNIIAEMCGSYSLLAEPILPQFLCPDNFSAEAYLSNLAHEGAEKKIENLSEKYSDRLKHEFKVISEAGLSPYFLIVQDYCRWARSQGWLVGKGRGSGAGSLVSYLLNITDVDPIKYDLLFERFYNAGRNQPGRISLPDIDCDFPIGKRDQVVEYMRKKYGESKVAQMTTFTRLQGRSALKDVLRAHSRCSFEEMNLMTEHIPDEASIAEEMQEMRDERDDASLIRWALENHGEELSQWCTIGDNGELKGNFARDFAQAIRLEGSKRGQGRHAAGVVISQHPLAECCPMIYDKVTEKTICGLEMGDLESMGLVKFDILGVAALDKIMGVSQLLRGNKIG